MSYAVIMDCIAERVVSPENRVTITEEAEALSRSEDGVIPLKAGTEVSFRELLHGMLIASSNECALALAAHAAGNKKTFLERLVRKSGSLGLSDKVSGSLIAAASRAIRTICIRQRCRTA